MTKTANPLAHMFFAGGIIEDASLGEIMNYINNYKCPILVSRKRIKGGVLKREFYTKFLPKEDWENCIEAIQDALNCHLIEPIQYGGKKGNNRHRIILYTAHGVNPRERGVLHDEDF